MDESRRQFEDWFMTTFDVDKYWLEGRRCEPESYTLGEKVLIYWESWKASRQTIEIVLPEPYEDGHGNLWVPREGIEGNIRATGLKIKGDSNA